MSKFKTDGNHERLVIITLDEHFKLVKLANGFNKGEALSHIAKLHSNGGELLSSRTLERYLDAKNVYVNRSSNRLFKEV